jgi:2-keto-3-deoxy-L-rhamnonate aldolase RhmA
MDHQFRKRLRAGELLVGTNITLASPEVAEILTSTGYDWLFLDAEHTPLQALQIQRLLQAAGPGMPCLVRLPASDETAIKKALDTGAAGIIAPMVNSAEHAQQVVRFSKYSPLGTRGVGLGRAHGYGLQFQEYVQHANENVAVVIQVEHIQAVENIDSIAQVEGLDAVLLGPYDLSASLGRLGEVEHPEVISAIQRVTGACQQAGIPLGVFGVSAEAVKPFIERGYTLIVAGVDTMMLCQAAKKLLAQVKE